MITIIFSTHKDEKYNNDFISHLKKTIGVDEFEILPYQNDNQYSLAEIYNKGIEKSKYDIVVCCHNDIILEKGWGKSLLKDFQNNPQYGIIGLAGSSVMPESGIYWEQMQQTMCGNVYHKIGDKPKYKSKFSPKFHNKLLDVVTIDGLFISFDKSKIKHKFDENIGKFHFYDHCFTIPNYLDGVKIGVTFSFEITHFSAGVPNDEFHQSRGLFLSKYSEQLPITLKPSFIQVDDLNIKIKNQPKVSIIILSKDRNDLLFQCISSITEITKYNNYEIIIADTGSKVEVINEIKNKILTEPKIKLVEYNYYNFAKINNDVVKNHISLDSELLLFCNNDIKLLNDSVSLMVKTYQDYNNTGTIGIRLHYEDNTVQHGGVLCAVTQKNELRFGHYEFGNYYNYSKSLNRSVFGNTGAFMMISKKIFLKCEMFNENYTECFEDVELSIKAILNGCENIYLGNGVAYHYESQTRKKDTLKQQREYNDMVTLLYPMVKDNLVKLEKYILLIN